MSIFSRLAPKTMPGQMMAVLALSFAFLLASLVTLEITDQENVTEWAANDATIARIKRMRTVLENIRPETAGSFMESASTCHEGYTVTQSPYGGSGSNGNIASIHEKLVERMSLESEQVAVTPAELRRAEFSYAKCESDEIELPTQGLVISVKLTDGQWLNAEIHPHEWHLRDDMMIWVLRSIAVFLFVGTLAVLFIRRLTQPLRNLTDAAEKFGTELEISPVSETGPPDLRRALESFNIMQNQVADEVAKRTRTLASISHDIRSPLTALRIKTELIEDEQVRSDLNSSIKKMERMIATSLDYLKGQSNAEPVRQVDLVSLIQSECDDYADIDHQIEYAGPEQMQIQCRPDALSRALRNLIDNALRHGTKISVELSKNAEFVDISVKDNGPGIAKGDMTRVLIPFERLSLARENCEGGFGLGLAIVQAIAEVHGGTLILQNNKPTGLVATIQLPVIQTSSMSHER